MISKTEKGELISKSARHKDDTGSPEIQITILSERIAKVTGHLQKNKHDIVARRSLLKMVSDRKKHLAYLKSNKTEVHDQILESLKR